MTWATLFSCHLRHQRTNKMLNRFAIAILGTAIFAIAILTPPVSAQIRATGTPPGTLGIGAMPATARIGAAGPGRPGFGIAGSPTRFHREHSSGRSAILLPYPYYYSDYGYDSGEAVQPQVVVVPAAAPAQSEPPAPPLEPLLIEWQGDHFERMTPSQKTSGTEQIGPDSAKSAVRAARQGSPSSISPRPARRVAPQRPSEHPSELPRELPPAVLVFHDGRTEEVSNYTIMSGTIYSKADYWATGSWTRKIQIADLDVPATVKLNHEHGLNFVLPGGPNEVVTRP
jgi:hypothetical protein